ncbi:MAG: CocE/NonD family hydrolase [SAR324 cluster bacterium]|nr:CocE/NonD family hydrolase [SAR324 cluster bacterium]
MPEIKEKFLYNVRNIENCWIPVGDGCRLAARIWLPDDAEQSPVPAILEALPYRKRDFTRSRDEPMHSYYAGHGYASVRIDLRGSGDSDGLLLDEYTSQELQDIVETIQWIADQAWCDGKVGMTGISWGGFNSLQVAALQPPALKAILTLCSTDDRYADDVHYMGGCLLNENMAWGSIFLMFNAMPPDPEIVGERWREMWMQRLENTPLFHETWLRHQQRDAFWKHGSVCEDFSRIRCPVYAVGGWSDGYSNAVPRLLSHLDVPRKGLIGPWAHLFPHNGVPGPAIGFLQEALRWWDHWLKGKENQIMEEPMFRVWMQESVPPQSFYQNRPGRWIAENTWPSPRIKSKTLYFHPRMLKDKAGPDRSVQSRTPQTVGLFAGEWCGIGSAGEMPLDQRVEDGKSLRFTSDPLNETIEILGAAIVKLTLEVDKSNALVAVRLNDVAPDGSIARVSYGMLNLTHRNSHEFPEPLEPGKRYAVSVKLNDIAHVFPEGHSIRIAISTSYWPIAWPSPEAVKLKLFTAESHLELPVRPLHELDEQLHPFEKPEQGPTLDHSDLKPARFHRKIEQDLTTGETVYTLFDEGVEFDGASLVHVPETNLDLGYKLLRRYRIGEQSPLSAKFEMEQTVIFRRDQWSIRLEGKTQLSSTKENFQIQAKLEAFEGEKQVFEKNWDRSIPRKLV